MRSLRSLFIFLSGVSITLAGTAIGQFAIESAPSAATATMQVFPDVQKNTFFGPSVATMVRSGVVKGYDDGNFGPSDPVTRAQVTVMIDRYDQNVVQPLRAQLEELRTKNNLGYCGDTVVQASEQCDDGNTVNGDGCNANCLKEIVIAPAVCGNGKCEVGEASTCLTVCSIGGANNCKKNCSGGTCPEDCQTGPTPKPVCSGEGEKVFSSSTFGSTACCSKNAGVKPSAFRTDINTCIAPSDGSLGTCVEGWWSTCGNGRCDTYEDSCTCPKDCGQIGTTEQAPALQPQQIGGQTDAHGCYISAGYSWCATKQECIRSWEEKCE
ncbi:hypothetical protein A2529_00680 [Candidatus Peribacteria bacterium RIFOXYD2_FULL_58_15]|nr:MAG: hypothetical protein A2529_00680 [Candidatus Peribacteria bacterium RIFOXYD2_FULL_58_15]